MYEKYQYADPFYLIKKQKIAFNNQDLRRIQLAFECKLQSEMSFALNILLLYSCNTQYIFYFDQHPWFMDLALNYIEYAFSNLIASRKELEEVQASETLKSMHFMTSHNPVILK